jgi:putative peptide zinc metalloprotease protein
MRRLTVITLAALLAFALLGSRAAPAQAGDNVAVAINTKDGADIFKLAFKIARVNQQIVDDSNAAAALASCVDCQTIAVAFQVVLIFSDPDVISSQNLAIAENYECDACVTIAEAYQWLLTTGGAVHFTAEGNRRLAEIRQRLHDLANADLALDEFQAKLDEIAADLADVLKTELVPAGPAPESPPSTETTTTTEPTTTTTTTTEPTTTEGSTTTTTP